MNSKSPLWGSPIEDARGTSFHGMIDRSEMTVLNNGDTPTFKGPRGTSHITAVTAGLYDRCSGWYIPETESMSDHRLIEFKIEERETGTGNAEYQGGFCNKKANWERFTEEFREQIEPLRAGINARHDVDNLAAAVNQAIQQACASSMPRRKRFRRSVPWWTPELTDTRKEVRRLRRRCQRAPSERRDEYKREYIETFNSYKTMMLQTRMDKWREFCTENSQMDPWGAAYKALRKKRPATKLTCLRKEDNTYTRGIEETAGILLERFFPDDRIDEDQGYHTAVRREARTARGGTNDIPITTPEVRRAAYRMSSKKAPGIDGITADAVQMALEAEPEAITGLFNRCIETGTFPAVWKQALVKPIPKPGKEDMTELKS